MSQKISLVLGRINHFRIADAKSEPAIVVLYARAAVASKMISIVEIVKKEVEKEGGRWWQYSKLEGRVEELKVKLGRGVKGVKEVDDGEKNGDGIVDGNQRGNPKSLPPAEGSEALEMVNVEGRAPGAGIDVDDAEELEEAFETMALPQRTHAWTEKPKVRNIPVMTIYITRVSVPVLKDLYGEQTNA
ncbi:MAG: hypothetical protein Q9217_006679 [Psora testacea]